MIMIRARLLPYSLPFVFSAHKRRVRISLLEKQLGSLLREKGDSANKHVRDPTALYSQYVTQKHIFYGIGLGSRN